MPLRLLKRHCHEVRKALEKSAIRFIEAMGAAGIVEIDSPDDDIAEE